MSDEVKCPKCGYEFELSQVYTSQIRDQIKKNIEKEIK